MGSNEIGRGGKREWEERVRGKKKGKDRTEKRKKMKRMVVKKQMGEKGRVRKGTQNQEPRIKTLNFRKRRIINYENGRIKKCMEAINFPISEAVAHDNNLKDILDTFTCISLTIQALPESSVQFSSAAQSCPTLWDPMDCSTPGLPVHHQEFTQTHVHWVGDAIRPSHPLLSPSLPAFNLSQHQSFPIIQLFSQVAKVLEHQLQHHSFQWIFRVDFL